MPKPTPYRAKDGTVSWRVRFRHDNRETSETFATERAARIFCNDIADRGAAYAVAMRDADDADRRGKTLDEVFDLYLEWKSTGPRKVRSDRSIKDYRRRYELAIQPALGGRRVATITEEDVAQWVEDAVAGRVGARVVIDKPTGRKSTVPLSPKSIVDRHALLHGAFKYALSKKWITSDPCAGTDLPERRKKPPKGLRPGEWQALHAALRQIDPDAADLASFLLATGWRFGEATALTTYDVEDNGYSVWVTVTQVMRRDATGRTHPVEDAKSAAGQRRIKLDRQTAEMVRARVARTRPGEYVFATKTGAPWHHSHFRSRAWEPAVDVANLARRPTPHWLRHTHVGWMIMTKAANLPELSSRLGHASITTTVDVYGRMVTDVSDDALDAFSAMRDANPQSPPPLTITQ